MSSRNIHPAGGLSEGTSLAVRVYDTVRRVKIHRGQLSNLSRQCNALLSTVREYSPRLVETAARAEADDIERAVEYILKKLYGWAKLSDRAAYLKQNEIQRGIEQCHQELATYTEKFTMALSMMNNSESQMKELARQRDHQQLVDMIARLSEQVRNPGHFITTEPLQQGEPLLQTQVIDLEGQQGSLPVVPPSRTRTSDLSGKVSRAEDLVAIEGSLLVFYLGEWTNRDHTALARLRDQSSASEMRFKQWIEASVGLQHRNVLSAFGHVTIKGVVHAVNPWMENGNIRDYIRSNPRADRMRLLGEVASGMEFLHENRMIHGDLCGKNILVNGEGKAFVCGFGLSEFSNSTSGVSRARWFAPERITTTSITPPTEEVDVWSFGLLCLEVFTGEDPYRSYSDFYVPVLLKEGTTPEHPGSTAVGLTSNMWELMQSCWQINPAERPLMSKIQSTICSMLPRRPRQPSTGNKDLSDSTFHIIDTPNAMTYQGSSSSALPGSLMLNDSPPSITYPLPETFDHKAETRAPTGNRKTSDASSLAHKRLPPVPEASPRPNILTLSLSDSAQLPTAPEGRSRSRPSTVSGPSPTPLATSDLQRRFSVDSSSSQSTSSTSGSGPRWQRIFSPNKNSRRTPTTSSGDSLPPGTPSSDDSSIHRELLPSKRLVPSRSQTNPINLSQPVTPKVSRSTSLCVLLSPSHEWVPVSPTVLRSMEKVASDSVSLLRPATDGTVLAGNLEGLVSRVISGTADSSMDNRFRAAFLTIYQLFAPSERLFEILKRRFESTDLDHVYAPARYSILLVIESWLKKGFEDEEFKCSSRIKEFALAIVGSRTMEAKAKEIVEMTGNPEYVRLRRPGSCARLRQEPGERPRDVTPNDLAAALTVVEGERFQYITYWDYVDLILQRRRKLRRVDVFNAVHDLVTTFVQRTVLQHDNLAHRRMVYEEWIHTAQACRSLNNFSSTAAIVRALTSPIITALPLTCEIKAKPILQALVKNLTPTDGMYQRTLQRAATNILIPWLVPHLSSLSSTFACSSPIYEVDRRPLIDFTQCSILAEEIDSLAQYSPPRIRNVRPDVVARVEYCLKSCDGDNALGDAKARSIKFASEERAVSERRTRMQSLGMVSHHNNRSESANDLSEFVLELRP